MSLFDMPFDDEGPRGDRLPPLPLNFGNFIPDSIGEIDVDKPIFMTGGDYAFKFGDHVLVIVAGRGEVHFQCLEEGPCSAHE